MDLNEAIWNIIDSKPKTMNDAQKRALHVDIMRAIEVSKTQVGKKLGVTIMTHEASLAGDAANKTQANPGQPKPKTV